MQQFAQAGVDIGWMRQTYSQAEEYFGLSHRREEYKEIYESEVKKVLRVVIEEHPIEKGPWDKDQFLAAFITLKGK